jgi:hypothetical protein
MGTGRINRRGVAGGGKRGRINRSDDKRDRINSRIVVLVTRGPDQ